MNIEKFVRESNKIEGIHRDPIDDELEMTMYFMKLEDVTVRDLENFVAVFQPGAVLRRQVGQNVSVGGYVPHPGGPSIEKKLQYLLDDIENGLSPWRGHVDYEKLHPFTDGNGRSGRMLWAWQMGPDEVDLGFLHTFYYQTLQQRSK